MVRCLAIAVLPFVALTQAHAQIATSEAPVAEAAGSESSTVVYGQDFFAQYTVTTAEDILRRIPGVSAILDASGGGGGGGGGGNNNRRGFGSDGDQVLINGRRLAGKSNEISSALRRIQIQNLERVELIRGTNTDIDVRSDGVVVNIVLKEGDLSTSSGSVMVASQLDDSGWVDLDGAIHYNGEVGKLAYFLGLEKISIDDDGQGGYTHRVRDERYYYPTGEILQVRPNSSAREADEYLFAANSTYQFTRGGRLQLNGLIKPSSVEAHDTAPFVEYDLDGTPISSGIDLRSEVIDSRLEWELGGTYEKPVGEGGNFKILWVYTHDDISRAESRDEIVDGTRSEVSRNPSDELQTEAILRGSYYWPLTANQTLELGAETAKNALEQTIAIYADENGDGIAEAIDIFNPSSKVEETRNEVFVNHNWTLSERWTASSSLVAESSDLSQSGSDITNETGFDFVKPRLDLRFAATTSDQWRLKIERTVSQLNFSNFVPRYNIREDRFSAGNPDLRPETAWEYEFGYEHRLANDEGVVEARVFYKDIQDRIENIALDVDNDGDLDPASGNIGDATDYGYEIAFSIRMARLGVPDLILDGGYMHHETSVTDPFTGVDREMGMSWKYTADLGLRHDVAAWNLSYGVTYESWGGDNARSDLREFRHFIRGPETSAFLEKRFGTRWTTRVDAFDLTQGKRERTREVFASNAPYGVLDRLEYFAETRDRRYTISVTAAF